MKKSLLYIGAALFSLSSCGEDELNAEDAKSAYVEFYKIIIGSVSYCEISASEAAQNLQMLADGKTTSLEAYSRADKAKEDCDYAVTQTVRNKLPGGMPDKVRTLFAEDDSHCLAAASYRSDALAVMLELIDGDQTPSKLNEFQKAIKSSNDNSTLCGILMASGGSILGITSETLE